MKRTKQILKSRQGIAIENAVVFMLVIFLLCALITSLTTLGNYQTKIENLTLQQKAEIDQIGEDYIASVKEPHTFDKDAYENYTCTVTDNTLTVSRDNKLVLCVEHENDGTIITKWCYSNP